MLAGCGKTAEQRAEERRKAGLLDFFHSLGPEMDADRLREIWLRHVRRDAILGPEMDEESLRENLRQHTGALARKAGSSSSESDLFDFSSAS